LLYSHAASRRLFFTGPATTRIYTLSLHDALPICRVSGLTDGLPRRARETVGWETPARWAMSSEVAFPRMVMLPAPPSQGLRYSEDRKSTRLNSSVKISYAVFCLKKKTTAA